MKKKYYEEPDLELISVLETDIIMVSGGGNKEDNGNGDIEEGWS